MDSLPEIEKQVLELKCEIAELRKDVQRLSLSARHPIEALLWQHGFPVISQGGRSQLVFPNNIDPAGLAGFYSLMRRYSFRLFMRDLIMFPEGGDLKALARYCSLKTVRSYMAALDRMGVVSLERGYRLIRQVPSFGPTLEWYVCEIFQREFMAPAIFNARLENTRFGGDYDVISTIAGRTVYVEVKSSPPRGVEHPAVEAFLGRIGDLQPHISVLFVDTELRMKDKLVPLLEAGLAREGKTGPAWSVKRLINEIFHVEHKIYLINSRKGIYTNLRVCFRDFFMWETR